MNVYNIEQDEENQKTLFKLRQQLSDMGLDSEKFIFVNSAIIQYDSISKSINSYGKTYELKIHTFSGSETTLIPSIIEFLSSWLKENEKIIMFVSNNNNEFIQFNDIKPVLGDNLNIKLSNLECKMLCIAV